MHSICLQSYSGPFFTGPVNRASIYSGGIAILLGFLQAHEIVGVFRSPNLIPILQLNAVGIAIVPDLEDLPTWSVRLYIPVISKCPWPTQDPSMSIPYAPSMKYR